MRWLHKIGQKTSDVSISRSDIWVLLYVFLTITSSIFFFGCGAGVISPCSDTFILSNTSILIMLITGMMVDLGIRRWKEDDTSLLKTITKLNKNFKNLDK